MVESVFNESADDSDAFSPEVVVRGVNISISLIYSAND